MLELIGSRGGGGLLLWGVRLLRAGWEDDGGVGIGALWQVLDHVGWQALGRKFLVVLPRGISDDGLIICLNHASGRCKRPAGAKFSG